MLTADNIQNYFTNQKTPCYFYDASLLKRTLREAKQCADRYGYFLHYAVKANYDRDLLHIVQREGYGLDCVSGNEIKRGVECGFSPKNIVFAGVAKSDDEIAYALGVGCGTFNCESLEEVEVINNIAEEMGVTAQIGLRLNPNIDAHTHSHITTGKAESKFGLSFEDAELVLSRRAAYSHIEIKGLHFHIGSQITSSHVWEQFARKVNEAVAWYESFGTPITYLNVGGGLGIDYQNPQAHEIPDFSGYFEVFHRLITAKCPLHFELGRSLVAQCGELVTRVLYKKIAPSGTHYLLVDAGMTDLIRPAFYGAQHLIESLTTNGESIHEYTIGGPICESSDIFAKNILLPQTKRGDLLVIRSAGAYGQVMASNYNLRELATAYWYDEE